MSEKYVCDWPLELYILLNLPAKETVFIKPTKKTEFLHLHLDPKFLNNISAIQSTRHSACQSSSHINESFIFVFSKLPFWDLDQQKLPGGKHQRNYNANRKTSPDEHQDFSGRMATVTIILASWDGRWKLKSHFHLHVLTTISNVTFQAGNVRFVILGLPFCQFRFEFCYFFLLVFILFGGGTFAFCQSNKKINNGKQKLRIFLGFQASLNSSRVKHSHKK